MKKRLLFVLILSVFAITLSGCGKKEWEEKFEVSEFKYEDKYVKGEIKNRTNEDFIVKIYFEYTSGSIKEEDTEELLVKGGSTEKVSSHASSIDEKYKIKIKNIEFNPTLKIDMDKDKQLTSDELKNAFYNVHKLHFGMTSVSGALVKGSYNSYTNELIYYVAKKPGSTDNHIYIYGDLYGGIIRLLESYKADSQKPEVIGLTVKDKSFLDEAQSLISGMLDSISIEMYDKILSYSERSTLYRIIEDGGDSFFGNFFVKRNIKDNGYEILIGF